VMRAQLGMIECRNRRTLEGVGRSTTPRNARKTSEDVRTTRVMDTLLAGSTGRK
jgi:hypothetical protein